MSVSASRLEIVMPRDKLVTYQSTLTLSGKTRDLAWVKVNDYAVPLVNNAFSCVLVLNKGKNLVAVSALGKEGKTYAKILRILRLEKFPDLQTTWAKEPVLQLNTLGFIEGYPDGSFYGIQPVTRGELASWLARVEGLSLPALADNRFLDVPKEHWRAREITAVVDADYMDEESTGYFGVDDSIKRLEAAQVAVKAEAAQVSFKEVLKYFYDVKPDSLGAQDIYAVYNRGLMIGVSKEKPRFEPERAMTRYEAAVLLSRFAPAHLAIKKMDDFEEGYSKQVYARLNTPPRIKAFVVRPMTLTVNTDQVLNLRVEVASREGFYPIDTVKVDLLALGSNPDVEMLDNGSYGDEVPGDGIYSLNLNLRPSNTGEKIITVTVTDKLGMEIISSTRVWVVK